MGITIGQAIALLEVLVKECKYFTVKFRYVDNPSNRKKKRVNAIRVLTGRAYTSSDGERGNLAGKTKTVGGERAYNPADHGLTWAVDVVKEQNGERPFVSIPHSTIFEITAYGETHTIIGRE